MFKLHTKDDGIEIWFMVDHVVGFRDGWIWSVGGKSVEVRECAAEIGVAIFQASRRWRER